MRDDMRPARIRPGGWVSERWRHRAAQATRSEDLRRAVMAQLGSRGCRHDVGHLETEALRAHWNAHLRGEWTPLP